MSPTCARRAPLLLLPLLFVVLACAAPASAWVASPNSLPSGPGGPSAPVAVEPAAVPIAWPIGPPAEGCPSTALSVAKVVAVVLGALAALKLPLLLAKVLLAKVLLAKVLLLPLALPLLVPFMMLAAMLPLPGFGMDDSPEPAGPATPPSPPPNGQANGPPAASSPAGGASAVTPGDGAVDGRAIWVERCVQRVACQLRARGSRKECAKFRCAAIDWLGGT